MCMICNHYNEGKLTVEEAFRNLDELIRCEAIDEEHAHYVLAMVIQNELDDAEDDLEFNLDDLFV